MENVTFYIDDLPIKRVSFYSYVKFPKGISTLELPVAQSCGQGHRRLMFSSPSGISGSSMSTTEIHRNQLGGGNTAVGMCWWHRLVEFLACLIVFNLVDLV